MAIKALFTAEQGVNTSAFVTLGGSCSYNTSAPISGTRDILVNPTGSNTGYCTFGALGETSGTWKGYLGPVCATTYVSFKVKMVSLPSATERLVRLLDYQGGVGKAIIWIRSDGKLELVDGTGTSRGTSTSALSTGTTYRIDFTVPSASGVGSLRINESVEITTGTENWGGADGCYLILGKNVDTNGSGYTAQFDDVVISNSAYAPSNYAIAHVNPDSDVSGSWTCSTGSDRYALVDDLPWSGADYITSNAAGSQQLMGMESAAAAGVSGTISAVLGQWYARQDTSASSWSPQIKSGGTTVTATASDPGTAAHYTHVMETDPNTSSAWTTGGIDALQIGGIDDAGSSARVVLMACGVMVLYAPSASDTEAPTVPGGLAVSSRTRSTLTWGWSASSDNVGVTGYEVSENDGTAIDKGNTLSHTKSGLADGTSVNLKVRAYDAAGNRSSYSANVQGTSYVGKWVVPANAAPSTSARMIVMATGTNPATVAQEGAVTADANGDFKLNDTTAAALDVQRLAVVHAYGGIPANSFNAAVGVATLTGE
jgi:hypothetical protein